MTMTHLVNVDCGTTTQDMAHLLVCPILDHVCTMEDLVAANEVAVKPHSGIVSEVFPDQEVSK
jgi:hypothetical protein